MNTAEKIAATYLRLNGFFLMPHFTVFDGKAHSHVDLVALHAPGAHESVDGLVLLTDRQLFDLLKRFGVEPDDQPVALVAEIKANEEVEFPNKHHLNYVQRMVGAETPVIPAGFSMAVTQLELIDDNAALLVGNSYALSWIWKRFDWMHEQRMRLTKDGSWTWSDAFLADLLHLHRTGWRPPGDQ